MTSNPVMAYAAAGMFTFIVLDFLYDFRRRPLLTYLLIVLSLTLIEFILTAVFGQPARPRKARRDIPASRPRLFRMHKLSNRKPDLLFAASLAWIVFVARSKMTQQRHCNSLTRGANQRSTPLLQRFLDVDCCCFPEVP